MRKIIVYLLSLILILAGCGSIPRSQSPQINRMSLVQTKKTVSPNDIRLMIGREVIKRGEYGIIAIQGSPGVTYNISATYNLGGKTVTSNAKMTAGTNGQITWVWNVSPNTVPGTYPITITGGGKTLKTQYTVTE